MFMTDITIRPQVSLLRVVDGAGLTSVADIVAAVENEPGVVSANQHSTTAQRPLSAKNPLLNHALCSSSAWL